MSDLTFDNLKGKFERFMGSINDLTKELGLDVSKLEIDHIISL
jgi:predicted metalloenzyme YecM